MTAATSNLPALPSSLSPEGNLSRYLSEIRKFPLLEPQQEFMLAKAWRDHGDTKSAPKPQNPKCRIYLKKNLEIIYKKYYNHIRCLIMYNI